MSGGVDSTAVLNFYIDLGHFVEGLFVDYGQLAINNERNAVRQVAEYYGVKLSEVSVNLGQNVGAGEIPGRNALLLSIALAHFGEQNGIIALGIHSGTAYCDCSQSFLRSMQKVFDEYHNGKVKVAAPFIEMNKKEIWFYCTTEGIPINLTYSCEYGKEQPCNSCLSCADLKSLYDLTPKH